MGINNSHYYGWEGKLHSPWWATLAIVRAALLQVFRRKSYWLVIALGIFQFLMYWIIIYVLTQARLPAELRSTTCSSGSASVRVPSRAKRSATSASCSSKAWW